MLKMLRLIPIVVVLGGLIWLAASGFSDHHDEPITLYVDCSDAKRVIEEHVEQLADLYQQKNNVPATQEQKDSWAATFLQEMKTANIYEFGPC